MAKKKTLEEKVAEAAGMEVAEGIMSASPDELKAKLVALDVHENETQDALDDDPDVIDLKEQLAQAKGKYTDALKSIKLQRKLAVTRLAEQGKA